MAFPVNTNLESLCVYTGTYNLSISSLSIDINEWRRHSFIHTWRPLSLLYGHNGSRGRFFQLHKTKPAIHISSVSWLHFMLLLFSNKGSFLETSCSWNNPGSQRDKIGHFWLYFSDSLALSRLLVLLCTRPSPEGRVNECVVGNCRGLNQSFSSKIFRRQKCCSSHSFSSWTLRKIRTKITNVALLQWTTKNF